MKLLAVAPHIYSIESQLGSRRLTQTLVVGDHGVLLFDTGVAGTVREQVLPALQSLSIGSDQITHVVISHADVDHFGGNGEVRSIAPGAAIRSHPLDRPLIESWDSISRERYGWYRAYGLDYDPATWRWLRESAGAETPLDGEVSAGEWIALGHIGVEVLALPGHSRGHIGLYDPSSETAMIADAAMGDGFETSTGDRAGPPPYVDLPAYRASIARLIELSPARVVTGHYPLLEGTAVARFLDRSRRFTDDLDVAIEHAMNAGCSDPGELLAPVAAELGGYPATPHELARSIAAHLVDKELRRNEPEPSTS